MKRRQSPAKSQQSPDFGQFRIIAGQWRSRKLQFPATEGLRPTPDRIRETLFNWLDRELHGANCLDLFSGSGALGLEALSRNAAHCTFIDTQQETTNTINSHLENLLGAEGQTLTATLPEGLCHQTLAKQRFDIVFIDPPYALSLITPCLEKLLALELLSDSALIYIENSANDKLPSLPAPIQVHRHKTAGQVQYALLHYQAANVD